MSAEYLVINTVAPSVRKFTSADQVGTYMWGRIMSSHVIMKRSLGSDWQMIQNPSSDITMLEFQLNLN